MNMFRDYINVVEWNWKSELLFHHVQPTAYIRLSLLESDLKSLRIALEDYLTARRKVNASMVARADKERNVSPAWPQVARDRMFHNAKVFVVCMRRFARLLKATKSNKGEYPPTVGEAIDLVWRKTRAFFEDYKVPRKGFQAQVPENLL